MARQTTEDGLAVVTIPINIKLTGFNLLGRSGTVQKLEALLRNTDWEHGFEEFVEENLLPLVEEANIEIEDFVVEHDLIEID